MTFLELIWTATIQNNQRFGRWSQLRLEPFLWHRIHIVFGHCDFWSAIQFTRAAQTHSHTFINNKEIIRIFLRLTNFGQPKRTHTANLVISLGKHDSMFFFYFLFFRVLLRCWYQFLFIIIRNGIVDVCCLQLVYSISWVRCYVYLQSKYMNCTVTTVNCVWNLHRN